jgi:hypothetical protein
MKCTKGIVAHLALFFLATRCVDVFVRPSYLLHQNLFVPNAVLPKAKSSCLVPQHPPPPGELKAALLIKVQMIQRTMLYQNLFVPVVDLLKAKSSYQFLPACLCN